MRSCWVWGTVVIWCGHWFWWSRWWRSGWGWVGWMSSFYSTFRVCGRWFWRWGWCYGELNSKFQDPLSSLLSDHACIDSMISADTVHYWFHPKQFPISYGLQQPHPRKRNNHKLAEACWGPHLGLSYFRFNSLWYRCAHWRGPCILLSATCNWQHSWGGERIWLWAASWCKKRCYCAAWG